VEDLLKRIGKVLIQQLEELKAIRALLEKQELRDTTTAPQSHGERRTG
jgi:hypothetical protein